MKRQEGEKDAEDVPEQCRLLRMNDDDADEDQFSFSYCWQTRPPAHGPGEGFFECLQVDQFPLRRRACGFRLPGASHAAHDVDRVRILLTTGVRLVTTLCGWQEHSDFDCDFTFFSHLVETPLDQTNLEGVRQFLCKELMCDYDNSSIRPIPIDEEHADQMMIVYPSSLDDYSAKVMKEFSEMWRSMELQNGFFFRGASGR